MPNSDYTQSRSGSSGPRRERFGTRPWRGRPRDKFRSSRPASQVEETPVIDPEQIAASGFAKLGLPDRLVAALIAGGITEPFEIQTATIPDALAGKDILGKGKTGSGKTLAFGLALLTKVAASGKPRPHHPQALVLVPTRELAMQVADVLLPLGKSLGVFVRTALGGVPYDRQIESLRRGVDVLVATPGRLGDLIKRGSCSLDDIEITVIDEADQLADMGFLPEITELIEQTPAEAQRLLFSATLDRDVDVLVRRFMHDPVTHSIQASEEDEGTMEHHVLVMQPRDKAAVTASIAARQGRTIMFVRTQIGVDQLVEQLAASGVRAGALHGGKTQRVRTRTLAEFREGRTDVLVATDVAARGIHVDGISLVVHVDPPKDPKDYLHRAGRTARAGESGRVVTLLLPRQRRSTLAMLDRAGVEPGELRVQRGDQALAELTGARDPRGASGSGEQAGGAPRRTSEDARPADGSTDERQTASAEGATAESREARPWRERREGGERSDDNRGYQRREGGYQQRSEGGYQRREGGYQQRSEGGYRDGGYQRREGGYQRPERGYQRREGGFQRSDDSRGYQRPEGGYQQRSEGGYRDGGYQRREGGYQRPEGGYQRREGSPRPDGERGGRDWYPRSAPRRGEFGGAKRDFGGPKRDFGGPTREHGGRSRDGGQWRDSGRGREGASGRDRGFGRDSGHGGQRPTRRYSS